MSDSYDRVEVTSRAQWRAWLAERHADSPGIWLVTYKKAADDRYVGYDDVVEEALAFGWVDSLPRKLDDERSMLLVTPRKPGSNWSRVNKERIARLTDAGLMAPAGAEAVARAQAGGAWIALDLVEDLREPDDLRTALDADSRRHWDAFPRSTKRGILEWIGAAKKPETRAKRVAETASKAAENVRANQWRQPKGQRRPFLDLER